LLKQLPIRPIHAGPHVDWIRWLKGIRWIGTQTESAKDNNLIPYDHCLMPWTRGPFGNFDNLFPTHSILRPPNIIEVRRATESGITGKPVFTSQKIDVVVLHDDSRSCTGSPRRSPVDLLPVDTIITRLPHIIEINAGRSSWANDCRIVILRSAKHIKFITIDDAAQASPTIPACIQCSSRPVNSV